MKRAIVIALLLCGVTMVGAAKKKNINYDESKVPNYTLSNPLVCNDGTKVTTVEKWEQQRRPEVLELFAKSVYGETPNAKLKVKYKVVAEDRRAFGGKATAQQVMFTFSKQGKRVQALVLVYYPNNRKGRVSVFVGYNFRGNHSLTYDEWIQYSPYYKRLQEINSNSKRLERGIRIGQWPMEDIINRGYAAVTLCYHDIYPDNKKGKNKGLMALLPQTKDEGSRWQALGVWAYGLSRVADWVEKQSWANKEQMSVIGHSRQGKVALWAGAQDKRFKVVISNDSGCGGAALSKRVYGENIASITTTFPHWFCKNFAQYSNREQDLPFDQHELLALVAPRYLYVGSASKDRWADPKGEYLSAYHASPVFELYGMKGLTSKEMPEVGECIHNDIGYHLREGRHALTPEDWEYYMDFCDKAYKKGKR